MLRERPGAGWDPQARYPKCASPFLEEIGATLCFLYDQVGSVFLNERTFVLRWSLDCLPGVVRIRRADFREVEEAFGVRFGFAHATSQLRQARADDCDG